MVIQFYGITIQISILLWTILCFTALMVILDRLLFRPLLGFMDQRKQKISSARTARETMVAQREEELRFRAEARVSEEKRVLPCFSKDAVSGDAVFREHSSVKLAPSVRFVGTVNFDETTRRLSTRLLDRANLVYLGDGPRTSAHARLGGADAGPGVAYGTFASWRRTAALSANVEKTLAALAEPLRAAARLRTATHAGDLLSLEELDATFARLSDAAPGRIVAVGGGAILDTAKILALAFATGRTPGQLAAGVPADIAPPPVFAFPTTAGSGAEATHFAVAYKDRVKKSIGHLRVRPSKGRQVT